MRYWSREIVSGQDADLQTRLGRLWSRHKADFIVNWVVSRIVTTKHWGAEDVESERVLVDCQLAQGHVVVGTNIKHIVHALYLNPELVEHKEDGRERRGSEALGINGAVFNNEVLSAYVFLKQLGHDGLKVIGREHDARSTSVKD